MSNPWMTIPLADYEMHMSLPLIGQAKMLADQLELLIERHAPGSVAIIGCAGGNGLERIKSAELERIVAVDINPEYIAQAKARHATRLTQLELCCADIQSESLNFGAVDLVYAALIFEYVDTRSTLASLRRNCRQSATLATLLQLPHAAQAAVTPSPYSSLGALAPFMKLLAPDELCRVAKSAGFDAVNSEVITLPSGKRFCMQVFRAR